MLFRTFFCSIAVTVVTLVAALIIGGPTALSLVAILAILEISLSFDNAVINASVLAKMTTFWQKIFLTVGIVIAVFGMRLVFPLALVAVTASMNPVDAFRLAVEHPDQYQLRLEEAHPAIAAFGGVFLLLIFLDFVFEERQIRWLDRIEALLARVGKLDQLSVVIALGVLLAAAGTLAPRPETVLISGSAGILTYLIVNGLGELFAAGGDLEQDGGDATAGAHGGGATGGAGIRKVAGKAAFFLFLYLEVLDASFSFDGVVGAFAISSNIIIISAGLGIGAMYVRSLTVFLVNKGTLSEYVYLEHGAHWAIGSLAMVLLLTIRYHIDEVVTGLIGVAFIAMAYASSVLRNRRNSGPHADRTSERRDSVGA